MAFSFELVARNDVRYRRTLHAHRRRRTLALGTHPTAHSKIPSYSMAILRVSLAVLFPQECFFAQYLPVDQPNAGCEVDQHNPVGKHQELPEQHKANCHTNRVAAKRKYARCDKLLGMVDIDANAKTPAKRNQAE